MPDKEKRKFCPLQQDDSPGLYVRLFDCCEELCAIWDENYKICSIKVISIKLGYIATK